jgi:lysozyme family protein
MPSRFNTFIPFVLKHETEFEKGHYGDWNHVRTERDPNDPGGTTRFGLDYGEHKESPWKMTEEQIANLTYDDAIRIYWKHWCYDQIELFPAKEGEIFFNCCTMSGLKQAKLIYKRNPHPVAFLKDELNVFDLIVQHRPASKEYLSGWKARIYDEAKFLGLDLLT